MTLLGIGYRQGLSNWIEKHPLGIGCLEITAEHFFDHGQERLRTISERYPVFVHGLGLSLGTSGPLDGDTLKRFLGVVKISNPRWISEHIAFTRTAEVDLGHLNPVRPTRETLQVLAAHARELADRCEKPLLLENITSHLRLDGDLLETDFLNQLCHTAGCRLLLDVTNLYINSRNHGFDPRQWLKEIEPKFIGQLHIVGYKEKRGRFEDSHSEPIQEDLLELLKVVIAYSPVDAVILERDAKLDNTAEIAGDLSKLEQALELH